jgi:dCMP deaminase
MLRTPNRDGSARPRPSLEETYLAVAALLAERSSCPDGARHGCVITVDDRIVATGYGSPAQSVAPCERCWLREEFIRTGIKDWSVCPAVHAEINAVATAARNGVSIHGGTAYVTREPCEACRRVLLNAGVATVIAKQP